MASDREIGSDIKVNKPAIHIASESVSNVIDRIRQREIAEGEDIGSTILVLGRYNFVDGVKFPYKPPQIRGLTVHKSKGLEDDYVIVNDMGSGKYGFPSQIREDPVISMLLASGEGFPNGEERRLFYVAITRAKKEVWLLESKEKPPSEFLIELTTDDTYKGLVESTGSKLRASLRCPYCKSLMQERTANNNESIFFGCIHYPRCYGTRPGCSKCNAGAQLRSNGKTWCSNPDCDQVPTACPSCETGILIRRTGESFDLIGCTTYPDCRHTQQIN